jgi:hypothetical protein
MQLFVYLLLLKLILAVFKLAGLVVQVEPSYSSVAAVVEVRKIPPNAKAEV